MHPYGQLGLSRSSSAVAIDVLSELRNPKLEPKGLLTHLTVPDTSIQGVSNDVCKQHDTCSLSSTSDDILLSIINQVNRADAVVHEAEAEAPTLPPHRMGDVCFHAVVISSAE